MIQSACTWVRRTWCAIFHSSCFYPCIIISIFLSRRQKTLCVSFRGCWIDSITTHSKCNLSQCIAAIDFRLIEFIAHKLALALHTYHPPVHLWEYASFLAYPILSVITNTVWCTNMFLFWYSFITCHIHRTSPKRLHRKSFDIWRAYSLFQQQTNVGITCRWEHIIDFCHSRISIGLCCERCFLIVALSIEMLNDSWYIWTSHSHYRRHFLNWFQLDMNILVGFLWILVFISLCRPFIQISESWNKLSLCRWRNTWA